MNSSSTRNLRAITSHLSENLSEKIDQAPECLVYTSQALSQRKPNSRICRGRRVQAAARASCRLEALALKQRPDGCPSRRVRRRNPLPSCVLSQQLSLGSLRIRRMSKYERKHERQMRGKQREMTNLRVGILELQRRLERIRNATIKRLHR